jgi:DNA-binding MarR family transcriptional regulator
LVNPNKEWKRDENLKKLLSLLKTHGELRFGELKDKLGVSEPTLAKYIRKKEEAGEIVGYFKQDRRERYYKITPEKMRKVEGQLSQYEAIKFIEGISNPVYVYDKEQQTAIAVFMSTPESLKESTFENVYQNLNRSFAAGYSKILLKILPKVLGFDPNISPERLALVIMVEGKKKEGVKP